MVGNDRFYSNKWLKSNDLWLQKSALLFQLKYKQDLDKKILNNSINNQLGSKEFFINKAIGWVLREYSRTNSKWGFYFTKKSAQHSLGKREALRLIKS